MGKEMKISTQKKARFLIKKIRLILISANKKTEKGKIKLKWKKDKLKERSRKKELLDHKKKTSEIVFHYVSYVSLFLMMLS
jgi:hypothetical protein